MSNIGMRKLNQLKIDDTYKALVPRPTKDERDAILHSMETNGFDCVFPVIINRKDVVLDGHVRCSVAEELAIEDVGTVVKEFDNMYDEQIFVIESNINRRQLNNAWRVLLVMSVWDLETDKAKNRQGTRTDLGYNFEGYEPSKSSEEAYGRSRERIAERFGISTHTLDKVKRILIEIEKDADLKNEWGDALAGKKNSYGKVPTVNSLYHSIKVQDKNDVTRIEKDASRTTISEIVLHDGDCLDILPKLSDINLAILDPPYNITDNVWDKIGTDDEYINWILQWMPLVKNTLVSKYHLFLFCASKYMSRIEMEVLRKLDLPVQSRIIWHRTGAAVNRTAKFTFMNRYDMIFHCGNCELNFDEEWTDARYDVQSFPIPHTNYVEDPGYHPTQKPLELTKRLVQYGSIDGDTVLDCFAGSGTVGEACNDVGGRKCILIEKDKYYIDIIERRCSNVKRL